MWLCYHTGTSIGGTDVVPFTTAGLADFVVVTDLHLQPGQVYYATIRGNNYVLFCIVSTINIKIHH